MYFDIGLKALLGTIAVCGTLCWITWLTYRSRPQTVRKRSKAAQAPAQAVERSGVWRVERTEGPSL